MRPMPKYFQVAFCLMLLFVAGIGPAAADDPLDFSLMNSNFTVQQGHLFSINALLGNPITNSDTYTIDNVFITSPGLSQPGDLMFDPTNFFFNFAGTYAPGTTTGPGYTPFGDFTVSNTAAVGSYVVNLGVGNSGGPLTQTSFNLQVQSGASPTPEFGSVWSLGGLLLAGGVGAFWQMRRRMPGAQLEEAASQVHAS